MRLLLRMFLVSLFALVASCGSVDSRVQKNQAVFNSWPADVQEKVRAGKVEVGFTQEMVRVALGEPDRLISRTTEHGVAEGWVYFDKAPKFSLGVGVGTGGRHSSFGGGVTVGDEWRDDEKLRVIFQGGRVSAVETRR